jgi:ubiquinone/menaquinone biosynthesis C-methylase UbiE
MATTGQERHVGRFGRWAETYDSSPLQRMVFEPIQNEVVGLAGRLNPEAHAILDIGCGTGQLLRRLALRFPEADLTGIDPSPEMISAACAALPEGVPVTFVKGYAERLPFEDDAFEAATTTMSFHHWADQPASLHEIARVLSPGGVFLLADALPTGWLRWVFTRNGHGTFNPPDRMGEMLCDAGFEVEGFHPVAGFGNTLQVVVGRIPGI